MSKIARVPFLVSASKTKIAKNARIDEISMRSARICNIFRQKNAKNWKIDVKKSSQIRHKKSRNLLKWSKSYILSERHNLSQFCGNFDNRKHEKSNSFEFCPLWGFFTTPHFEVDRNGRTHKASCGDAHPRLKRRHVFNHFCVKKAVGCRGGFFSRPMWYTMARWDGVWFSRAAKKPPPIGGFFLRPQDSRMLLPGGLFSRPPCRTQRNGRMRGERRGRQR